MGRTAAVFLILSNTGREGDLQGDHRGAGNILSYLWTCTVRTVRTVYVPTEYSSAMIPDRTLYTYVRTVPGTVRMKYHTQYFSPSLLCIATATTSSPGSGCTLWATGRRCSSTIRAGTRRACPAPRAACNTRGSRAHRSSRAGCTCPSQ